MCCQKGALDTVQVCCSQKDQKRFVEHAQDKTSPPHVLTGHAVEAKGETDKVLQFYASRVGSVTQGHQIQHVIGDPLS